jgi:hypothetical protein
MLRVLEVVLVPSPLLVVGMVDVLHHICLLLLVVLVVVVQHIVQTHLDI